MKTIIHKAEDRGHANMGWLNSYHSFSFGRYYNPDKIHFGALRVLNDDTIDGGTGFGKHPHDNMEIISIPLNGELAHEDSTGKKAVIYKNDVQIMSAGTGIQHAEKNNLPGQTTSFLQIWILPKEENIQPRYGQKTFDAAVRKNNFQTIVSPSDSDAIWINQDAFLSLGDFDKGQQPTYSIKHKGNGVYVFVLKGSISIDNTLLTDRDAMGIYDTESFSIKAEENAELLLIEVPMLEL